MILQASGLSVGGMVLSPEFIIAVIGIAVGYGVLKARVDSAARGIAALNTKMDELGHTIKTVQLEQATIKERTRNYRRRSEDAPDNE